MDYKCGKWKRLRLAVLRRDAYRCQECKRYGRFKDANVVHHVLPCEYFEQYEWETWNLISLCTKCHDSMHSREKHLLSKRGMQVLERVALKNNIVVTEMDKKFLTKIF